MAKVASKGTVLYQELSSVMTPVAQLTEVSQGGYESETYDSTTLDSGVGKEYSETGYVEGGTVDISGFFDPSLAGHQAIHDLVASPASQNWKIAYPDAAEMTFTSAGLSFEVTAATADGLKFSSSIKVTGLQNF